jgi:hypothetical protein
MEARVGIELGNAPYLLDLGDLETAQFGWNWAVLPDSVQFLVQISGALPLKVDRVRPCTRYFALRTW